MNINLQLPLLMCMFYLFAGAISGVSEDRRFPGTRDLVAIEYQRTKSISIPRASPTPLPPAWHGFVPLESTRIDIERVLGKPEKSRYSTDVYNTADDRIDVLYSEGPCAPSEVERWNVSKDVIIRIDVRPKHSVRVTALVLDKNKYLRTRESHPNNWFTYWNKEDGIRVETIKTGQVEEVNSITYGPKAKHQSLRCLPN
jgi:hypothetical protein